MKCSTLFSKNGQRQKNRVNMSVKYYIYIYFQGRYIKLVT